MVQDASWATPIKQPTMCSHPSWQGYKPDYWMGSLDEQLLEGGDYLEAQILSNPISHEGNDEDGRRIIYRWVSVSYNYGLNMLRFSISMVPGHSFAIQRVPCFPSSNCIHYYYIWLSLILKEILRTEFIRTWFTFIYTTPLYKWGCLSHIQKVYIFVISLWRNLLLTHKEGDGCCKSSTCLEISFFCLTGPHFRSWRMHMWTMIQCNGC